MPIFHVAFSSREMLVKRKLLFLPIACITRNGVPSPAGFRHFTEVCEVDSHVSHRFPPIRLTNRRTFALFTRLASDMSEKKEQHLENKQAGGFNKVGYEPQ